MDATDLEDTEYEQDALADLVDFEATPEEVLNRIEHCISAFLDELSCGRLQSIQTASGLLPKYVAELQQSSCYAGLEREQQCIPCLCQRGHQAATGCANTFFGTKTRRKRISLCEDFQGAGGSS